MAVDSGFSAILSLLQGALI